MEHISLWLVQMMVIYWVKTNITKDTEVLLDTGNEVGLEVNAEKTNTS
jgi:hypothetical protein